MSSLFGIAANGASSFYNGATSASMRFRRGIGSNTEINRDPSSAGDRKKHTVSVWVKRSSVSDGSQVLLGGFASSYSDFLYFRSDDRLEYTLGNAYSVSTNMRFRDTANWYHIVTHFDVANSTTTDRLKFYVNGVEQTKTVTYGSYPANTNYAFSNTVDQTIGGLTNFGGYEFEGYLCDYHFIDGSLVSHNSFGEFKNGIWIPKIVNTGAITYGTNGFRLEFKGTDTDGPSTSGSVNSNSVGASSVNSNHFHAYNTNQQYHSALPDNPENNFCTLNKNIASGQKSSATYSDGALKYTSTDAYDTAIGTMGVSSGKWYFETRLNSAGNQMVGLRASPHTQNTSFLGQTTANSGISYYRSNGNIYNEGSGQDTGFDPGSSGDIIQVAFDADNGYVWFGVNGTFYGTVDTSSNRFTLASYSSGEFIFPAFGYRDSMSINFGQDGTFGGQITAGGNTDANGIGNFKYSVPSGYLALCSANLPDTELSPNQLEQADDYFVTTTYSGDSNNNTQVSTGFQPDWVWIKSRNEGSSAGSGEHMLYDTNRGVQKDINTSDTGSEATNANGLQEFGSTFFRPGSLTRTNETGDTYVSWNWKLNGGTTSTDNNGSIASTVQTNSKVGISIATFTVSTQGNFSFGHGLGSVPEMFWWNSRTSVQGWIVYHPKKTTSVPGQPGIYLNSSLAGFTTGGNWITELSSTRIAITDGQVSSGSNRDDVVYSFKSVEGFSKIGDYVGNASTDGTFIYTGFRPAWVILKRINAAGHWLIFDNKRDGYNPDAAELKADDHAAEVEFDRVDFVSNGFKQKYNGTDNNGNGDTYVYMAFAEQPFKFSNAR